MPKTEDTIAKLTRAIAEAEKLEAKYTSLALMNALKALLDAREIEARREAEGCDETRQIVEKTLPPRALQR